MAEDFSATFERLRASAQKLNNLTDAAAQLVKNVEQFLEESGVGMRVSVLVKSLHPEDVIGAEETRLEYRRTDSGKYRISVSHYIPGDPGIETKCVTRPWSECTREEKLESLAHLPDLLLNLAKQLEEQADHVEKVLAGVAPKLPVLQKKKGGV